MSAKTYDPKFKIKVVLESLNPNTTLESVKSKYNLSNNAIFTWRNIFFKNAHVIFDSNQKTKSKINDGNLDIDQLKKLIGELTIQNDILKKVSNLMH